MSFRLSGDQAALLDFAVSHSPVVYFASDPVDDFRITFITDNIERLSGHAPDAILADPAYTRRHIHEDDLPRLEKALRAVAPDRPQECRYRIRRSDGDYVWFREEIRMAEDDGVSRIIGCMVDITDQIEAENERRRLGDLLRDAINSMPTGLIVYDPADRVALSNQAVAGLYGTDPETFVGRHANEMAEIAAGFIRSVDGEGIGDPARRAELLLERYRAATGEEFELEYDNGRCMAMRIQPTTEGGVVVTRTDVTERKAAERETAHTLAQLERFLDNSPSSVVKLDRKRRFVYINPAFGVRTGCARDEVIGRTPADVLGQDHADVVAPFIARALAGERVQWQGWVDYPAVGRRYVQRDYRPEDDAEGNIVGVIAFTHDLTELKQAQLSLEEREARFRAIAEAVPMPLHIVDNRTRQVVYANRLATENLGTTLGMTASELEDHFVDAGARTTFLERLSRDRHVPGIEAELHLATGDTRWFLISSRLMEYDGASATLTTAFDITDRKQAEQALADREAQYRTVLENTPSDIALFDRNRRYLYVNPSYCRRFGKSSDEIIGRSMGEIIGEDGAALTAPYAKRALDGERVEWQAWQLHDYAGDRYLNRVYLPQRDAEGRVVGHYSFTHDLTELKSAQSSLEEREARFRAIAEAIPHPLVIVRNRTRDIAFANNRAQEMLGAIVGKSADILEDQYADPAARGEYLSRLRRDRRVEAFEAELRLPNGARQWNLISAHIMPYDGESATISICTNISDLKRAEQALAESEIQHRRILENTPTAIVQLDRDRRYVYANPSYCERVGKPSEEIVGRTVVEVVGAEIAEQTAEYAAKALAGETAHWQRWQTYEKSGSHFMQRIYQPDFDADGNVVGYYAITHDLTDLMHAQASLEEREARFRGISEAVPLPIVIVGQRDGTILFTNEMAAGLLGVRAGDDARKLERSFVDDAVRRALLAMLSSTGALDGFEAQTRRADGERCWELLFGRSMTYDGQPATLMTSIDITVQKRAEEALRASEAQNRTILDSLPARVVLCDTERRRIYANRRYRDYRGLSDDREPGGTPSDVLGDKTAEMLLPYSERALAGESVEFLGWINDPDKGREYQRRVYQPYHGADGGIAGYLTVMQDLTEQKRTEQELEKQRELFHQNEKLAALGSLLAGVAHELNNPLSVVVGRSIMLAEEVEDPAIANAVGRVRDAAERCARIVKTFLAMARQQAPSRRPVTFNDLVRASLDIVEYSLRTTDVRIELDLAADLPLIDGDPDQLSQVLVNLCINAGQAMEQSAERRLAIATGVDAAAGRITVDVSDTGCGINSENMSRIFDPFFTTKSLGVGTGVGLSISHAIVASHDGTIDVASEVGRGTAFHLTFPVAERQAADEVAVPAATRTAVSSILIVDDEVEIAEMLSELLVGRGHRVEIAHSGREALARLDQEAFDLIVSDLKMPDIGGRELYRLVENDRPVLRDRFLFITGDTLGSDMTDFISDAGLVCLEKPLIPADVLAAVAQALEVRGR